MYAIFIFYSYFSRGGCVLFVKTLLAYNSYAQMCAGEKTFRKHLVSVMSFLKVWFSRKPSKFFHFNQHMEYIIFTASRPTVHHSSLYPLHIFIFTSNLRRATIPHPVLLLKYLPASFRTFLEIIIFHANSVPSWFLFIAHSDSEWFWFPTSISPQYHNLLLALYYMCTLYYTLYHLFEQSL